MKSSLVGLFGEVVSVYPYVLGWKLYLVVFSALVVSFFVIRCPYVYGGIGFSGVVLVLVFVMYFGELFKSVGANVLLFFSSMVPPNTPYFVSPLVCLAETVSFVLRPVVLVLRPIVNLSIGVIGSEYVAGSSVSSLLWLLLLVFLLFYELAIFVIHSFIVWYLVEVTCKW